MKRIGMLAFFAICLGTCGKAQKLFTYLADFTSVSIYGFADSAGNTKTGGRYNLIMQPVEGICRVWAGQTSSSDYTNIRYGYCLTNGVEIIPPKYPRADDFSEGLARVGMGSFLDGYKYGYVDKKGIQRIAIQYKDARAFSQGLAAVQMGEKDWKYIDQTGTVKIAGPFLEADVFSEGLAAVSVPYDLGSGVMSFRKGYIDQTGKMVIKPEYNFLTPFRNGRAVASVSESTPLGYKSYQVLIDKTGKRLTSDEFVSISASPSEGYYSVKITGSSGLNKEGDVWGLVDSKGVLQACRSKQQIYVNEGLILFSENGKYGYMDKDGKPVIAPQFKSTYGFTEGLAPAQDQNGNWGFINKKGVYVIKAEYVSANRFSDGLAIVSKGKSAFDTEKTTGAIDKTGKIIIPFEKRALSDFKNGSAVAEQSYVSYLIYKDGRTSLACNVNTLANARYGLAALYKNNVNNALTYFQKEKDAGCPMVDYWLGFIMMQTQPPVRDTVQGAALIQKAAKAGYPEALYSLGFMQLTGLTGKKDTIAARENLVMAARSGIPVANTAIGLIEDARNPSTAVGFYQKAADMGEPTAMYNLALLYRDGRGVTKSDYEFQTWLGRAAERNYQPAVQLRSKTK